ncbi:unnamed protein product [Didymodactylos carnosus]|uniref:Uncharacterized protein n=1 Tax=Didymodactylos carnosus TaxID=1234261 RepID=A0A814I226_9BILA|nr:unnamed protein product [Didymodactylos carnosus]CAF3790047.1 unnamed protein product [Didymodactylos carnosus]
MRRKGGLNFGPRTFSASSKCTQDGECVHTDDCANNCTKNSGPQCTRAECINDQCQSIQPCSRQTCSKSNECVFNTLVACKPQTCPNGYEPPCTEPRCNDGICSIIPACSKRVISTTRTTSSPNSRNYCQTVNDCVTNKRCIDCNKGRGPACTQVTCTHKQCEVIEPCSQQLLPQCTHDNECLHTDDCRANCSQGMGPKCTKAECLNDQCETIPPCSKQTCSKKKPCIFETFVACKPKTCPNGYEPPCTEARCIDNICHIIPPCSKHTKTV